MGINVSDLKKYIVTPALTRIGLGGATAVNLVTGTAIVESDAGTYLTQTGNGPARGIFQMEGFTHDDLWKSFIKPDTVLTSVVDNLRLLGDPKIPSADEMRYNPIYAAAMCRIKYRQAAPALPAYNDAKGLCAYWKLVYNTPKGAGAVDAAHIVMFQAAVNA